MGHGATIQSLRFLDPPDTRKTIREGGSPRAVSHPVHEGEMTVWLAGEIDPALEISVDDTRSPVTIRLVGVLDETTSARFLSVIGDLILEGLRRFEVDTVRAVVDASGASALTLCQRRVHTVGGTLSWGGVRFDLPRVSATV